MANAARHKANLIQAAAKQFRENGYAATGLNEILAQSGAPRGSLYHYFPGGKEELGAAAVEFAGQVVTHTLADLAASSGSSRDFIERYCDMLSGWLEESEFRAGCPIATTLLETAAQSELIAKAGRVAFAHWINVIAGVFEADGCAPGQSRERAEVLIAAVEGALLLARVERSTMPIQRIARVFE